MGTTLNSNTVTHTHTTYLTLQSRSLHQSPHARPLALTEDDCEALIVEGESEEGERVSAELDSDASFESTMYEDNDE